MRQKPRKPSFLVRRFDLFLSPVVLIASVLIWHLVTTEFAVPAFILPPPLDVWNSLVAGLAGPAAYTASTTANVISSAGDAALSVSDPGHLMNGTFSLPSALEVSFSKSSWTAPTANEAVTIGFKQHIGATDALRTGTYSRTLTFTLSTTTP